MSHNGKNDGPKIKAMSGEYLHPDYGGGWEGFLSGIELCDEYDGVRYFRSVNCNYIVFPGGALIENFGYHGRGLMERVRPEGVMAVLESLVAARKDMDRLLSRLLKQAPSN